MNNDERYTPQKPPSPTLWYSSKGPIPVVRMTDAHLVNTIRLLQRRAYQERSNNIVQAAVFGGETAAHDILETTFADFTPGVYRSMVKEAVKRGLYINDEPEQPMPPWMGTEEFGNIPDPGGFMDDWETEDE